MILVSLTIVRIRVMYFRPVVTPYIFLGVDRVIAEAADELDESEVLSRIGLVARQHAEYVLLLEGAETARGCQDFHLRLGARQTDQTENRPDPHKCPHFSPPSVPSDEVFRAGVPIGDDLTPSCRDLARASLKGSIRGTIVDHVRIYAIVIGRKLHSGENFRFESPEIFLTREKWPSRRDSRSRESRGFYRAYSRSPNWLFERELYEWSDRGSIAERRSHLC